MKEVVPEYYGHSQEALDELFADTNSRQIIQKYTVWQDDNQINLPETAASFGVMLFKEYAGGNFGRLLLTHRGYEIILDPDVNDPGRQFVFAHEVGHIVLIKTFAEFSDKAIHDYQARIRQEPDYYKYTEAFCDYFAGHMLGEIYPKTVPVRLGASSGSTSIQPYMF